MENKNEITFVEFKAWLTGLIRGKRGALPDIEDWKQIKAMMERVVPEKVYQPDIPNIPKGGDIWNIKHVPFGPCPSDRSLLPTQWWVGTEPSTFTGTGTVTTSGTPPTTGTVARYDAYDTYVNNNAVTQAIEFMIQAQTSLKSKE